MTVDSIIASGLRALQIERSGLEELEKSLAGSLSEKFAQAVELISSAKGRLIVTGIGKSGHVGSKLAATFASTGTPAFFVHSAEANHGDLGMVSQDDVILALSWTGETAELKGIVNFANRFNIPLISITSNPQSALGRASTISLQLPKAAEACPLGLAPTTSTVMQLALGDALAVALLEARGFTPGDFRVFHPGGSLGASLMHVREVMHKGDQMPVVKTGTSMPEAMKEHSHKHLGCVVVIDEQGMLAGIVTDGDLARNLHRNLSELTVDDIMTTAPKTIAPDALISAAKNVLNKHHISALIVVEGERPLGIIHFHDLLRVGAV